MTQQALSMNEKKAAKNRTIELAVRGVPTSDGAGVKLTRVLGQPRLQRLDPFLMLDEFRSDEPQDYLAGFPDHPHRGFETITYMVAGRFRHRDNQGHEGLLRSGGAQWMTAGRGIVHSEMPEQVEGLVHGFQLWLNLPAKDKMREPSYMDLQPENIPVANLEGGVVARVLGGEIGGVKGPITGRDTEPVYIDLEIPAGASVEVPIPQGHEGFVYPFIGDLVVSDKTLPRGTLGVMSDEGTSLTLRAPKNKPDGAERRRAVTRRRRGMFDKQEKDKSVRTLVVAGKPIGEPVVQYGPFVMNTVDEIEQTIRDFQSGRF